MAEPDRPQGGRHLFVLRDGRRVGTLSLVDGTPGFAYAADWLAWSGAQPLSVALPLRREPYGQRATLAYFDGILPEETARRGAARALGISDQNSFALLDALGGDVAGAISLVAPEAMAGFLADAVQRTRTTHGTALSETEMADLIERLPQRPLLAGETGAPRLSLAGAQTKVPLVRLEGGGLRLPEDGEPSTHILKPEPPALPGLVANEAYVMGLAGAAGLPVAGVEVLVAGGQRGLLVERYDRSPAGARLHQEDACQALGLLSADKYEPGLRDLFGLIRAHSTRVARDVLILFDAVVFNIAVGNADAHAKNFSLLQDGSGVQLAPLYDLICTAAYPQVDVKFAMRVAGRATLDEIKPDDWVRLSEPTGLASAGLPRRARQMVERVEVAHALTPVPPGADAVAELVRERLDRLLRLLP